MILLLVLNMEKGAKSKTSKTLSFAILNMTKAGSLEIALQASPL